MMSIKHWIIVLLTIASLFVCGCGCSNTRNSKDTVSLNMWYILGRGSSGTLQDWVADFNEGYGAEQGISVNMVYGSDTDTLTSKLVESAAGKPGSASLPDIAVCSLTAIAIGKNLFIDWNDYLSQDKLSEYYPTFLAEGQYEGAQFILPTTKSTDVLFINKTLFDVFAEDCDITYDDLQTWEGLFETAEKYSDWAAESDDARINETQFFMAESIMDYLQLGAASLGESIWNKYNELDFSNTVFQRVFTDYADSVIDGGTYIGNEGVISAMISGKIVVGLAPSYHYSNFGDKVYFFDNSTMPLELDVLCSPYFSSGKPVSLLRSAGLAVLKSTEQKNQAATVFCSWLSSMQSDMHSIGSVPAKTTEMYNYLLSESDLPSENMVRSVLRSSFLERELISPNYSPEYYTISAKLHSSVADCLSSNNYADSKAIFYHLKENMSNS